MRPTKQPLRCSWRGISASRTYRASWSAAWTSIMQPAAHRSKRFSRLTLGREPPPGSRARRRRRREYRVISLASIWQDVTLLLILSALVVAHEWGHFIVARLFKIRVDDFSIGFGRRLVRLGKLGDTEYNIRILPLGAENTGEGAVYDGPDGFNSKPLWQRSLVIFAGPLMSFITGVAILCLLG